MIKDTSKTLRRIRDVGPHLPRVDPEIVRVALGAEKVEPVEVRPQGPMALFGLRQSLAARLHSTGGRPGLGETRRQKIPLSEEDWDLLCRIAERLTDDKGRPTPGQVASELLHQRLQELQAEIEKGPSRTP